MSGDESAAREPGRRRFFQVTGLAACGATTAGAAALGADFLRPRVLFEPATLFSAGSPDAFDVGSVLTSEVHRAFVVRRRDGFCALSSVCTHLGCVTRYQPGELQIACPCHGSRFSLEGDVLSGPAPRPLPWLQVSLSPRGEIEVDTALEVPQGTVFKL